VCWRMWFHWNDGSSLHRMWFVWERLVFNMSLDWFFLCFSRFCLDHYLQFTHLAGLPWASHSFLKVIWLACVWTVWKERNNYIFKNAVINPHNIVEKVKLNSFLWLSSNFVPITLGFHDWWRHPLLCMGAV